MDVGLTEIELMHAVSTAIKLQKPPQTAMRKGILGNSKTMGIITTGRQDGGITAEVDLGCRAWDKDEN